MSNELLSKLGKAGEDSTQGSSGGGGEGKEYKAPTPSKASFLKMPQDIGTSVYFVVADVRDMPHLAPEGLVKHRHLIQGTTPYGQKVDITVLSSGVGCPLRNYAYLHSKHAKELDPNAYKNGYWKQDKQSKPSVGLFVFPLEKTTEGFKYAKRSFVGKEKGEEVSFEDVVLLEINNSGYFKDAVVSDFKTFENAIGQASGLEGLPEPGNPISHKGGVVFQVTKEYVKDPGTGRQVGAYRYRIVEGAVIPHPEKWERRLQSKLPVVAHFYKPPSKDVANALIDVSKLLDGKNSTYERATIESKKAQFEQAVALVEHTNIDGDPSIESLVKFLRSIPQEGEGTQEAEPLRAKASVASLTASYVATKPKEEVTQTVEPTASEPTHTEIQSTSAIKDRLAAIRARREQAMLEKQAELLAGEGGEEG